MSFITNLRNVADALRIKLNLPILVQHASILSFALIHPKTGAVVFEIDPVTGLPMTAAAGVFDPRLLQSVVVKLTNAQVLALRATPFTIVAAPGANKIVKFRSASLHLHYGAAAYTESTANLALKYTNGSGAALSQTIEMTGFIDQTVDMVTNGEPKIDAITTKTAAVNAPIVLHNLGAAEFGGGNAGNTLSVRVNYQVVDAP